MKDLFLRTFYHPGINYLVRNTLRFVNKITGSNLQVSISGIVRFSLPNGSKMLLKTNESCAAVNYLYWRNGIMGYEYTPLLLKLLPRIKVFFDIGANVGYYTVLAKKINPDIEVHAFEPAKGPYYYLSENVRINKLTNVYLHNLALSDKKGEVSFNEVITKYRYLKHHLNGANSLAEINARTVKYNVLTDTLDNFARDNKITRIDILKIDAEMVEHLILHKAQNVVQLLRPMILMEVFDLAKDRVQKEIDKFDYKIFYHTPRQTLKPVNSFMTNEVEADHNYFLVPEEKVNLISDFIEQ